MIYGTAANGNTSATAGVQSSDTCFTQYFCNGSGGPPTGGMDAMVQQVRLARRQQLRRSYAQLRYCHGNGNTDTNAYRKCSTYCNTNGYCYRDCNSNSYCYADGYCNADADSSATATVTPRPTPTPRTSPSPRIRPTPPPRP